ncbi:hypothetical protein A2U01_0043251 [Trifolium medium]|uniref:Uncharacterized protein n=1 Tax=Trifolium medium TaxID=97028 RepID=A0A392QEZ2_9FABA|nr:hypothetical protein [Trifolium medium]
MHVVASRFRDRLDSVNEVPQKVESRGFLKEFEISFVLGLLVQMRMMMMMISSHRPSSDFPQLEYWPNDNERLMVRPPH